MRTWSQRQPVRIGVATVMGLVALAFGVPSAQAVAISTHVDSVDGTGGGMFTGTLSETDWSDWYTFSAVAGTEVQIGMTGHYVDRFSDYLDPFVVLWRTPVPAQAGDDLETFALIDADDDGGVHDLDSLLTVTLDQAGTHVVEARYFDVAGADRPYTLTIEALNGGTISPIGSSPPSTTTYTGANSGLIGKPRAKVSFAATVTSLDAACRAGRSVSFELDRNPTGDLEMYVVGTGSTDARGKVKLTVDTSAWTVAGTYEVTATTTATSSCGGSESPVEDLVLATERAKDKA